MVRPPGASQYTAPPHILANAVAAGMLEARGVVTRGEMIPALMQAAIDAGYGGCRSGLQARLSWAMTEGFDRQHRDREAAWWACWRAALAACAVTPTSRAVLAAAEAANRDLAHEWAGPLLTIDEVREAAEAAARKHHRERRRHA